MGGHDDAMEWTQDCEKYFLEILAERVKRHPNDSSVFKGTDWIEMDEQIFSKFALRYGPHKLKGKYHRLRSMHTKFCELINHTGVTWDSVSGKVFADDIVWDAFLKRHKIFNTFKKKGCKLYPLLTVVFSSSNGTSHNAPTSAHRTSKEKHRLDVEYVAGTESDSDVEGLPGMENDKFEALMDVWAQSMIARKERYLAKAKKYKAKCSEVTEEFSIIDCMAVLEATPGVSTASYNKALQYFLEVNWRKIFLLMSKDRRKAWLENLEN